MDPDHNWRRVVEAGVADRVCPMRAEAHALPFAAGYFDAVVSIDAYQYFGTDVLYLDYLARFLRPGGLLGVVVPGLVRPLGAAVPPWLTEPQSNGKVFWEESCRCFLTADAWRANWEGCPAVTGVRVDLQPDGWRHWADFERAIAASGKGIFPSDAEALETDAGRTIGFVRLTAERTGVGGREPTTTRRSASGPGPKGRRERRRPLVSRVRPRADPREPIYRRPLPEGLEPPPSSTFRSERRSIPSLRKRSFRSAGWMRTERMV